jgi:uncharacterized protein YbjT (DUF2867 family)
MKILLAGASGAIGRRLVPLLVASGHDVAATTRTAGKLDGLQGGVWSFIHVDDAARATQLAIARGNGFRRGLSVELSSIFYLKAM